ncbi:hypothetical protein E6R18_25260 [Streptomyces sp. A1277]|uniref:hypothetical protein n=1 Tax=Streptomyces sp. A1277 TaxID=2563103 RepID=UPI0010A298F6|nr:hypothetical protein [Streptomyces sp. A1277]THA29217.1 hypothetical protein E6R18_25260 [Streptomyces sp. A1277]
MLTGPIPTGLCPAHQDIALKWRNNHYDRHDPSEWPCGMSSTFRVLLMDFRTSHEEREQQFDEKNQQQIDLTARICRSGRSPQCTPRPADEAA